MYKQKYKKYKSKYLNAKHNNLSIDMILVDIQKYITSVVDRVDIIAMGEATHGQDLINELRLKTFKILAKKFGFTTFIIEDQYSQCELINNWVHGDLTFDLEYLMRSFFMPWKSVHMYNFIKTNFILSTWL